MDLALLSSDDPASTGFPSRPGATGPHGEPDLMALLSQITGQPPPNGSSADANSEDPMAQMMAALGNMQGGGFGGGPGTPQQTGPVRPPSLLQRCMPLLHLVSMVVLAGWIYVTAKASNMDWSVLVHGTQAGDPSRDAQSWAYERRALPHVVSFCFSFESVRSILTPSLTGQPVLAAFIAVEVVLQSIRAMVVPVRPCLSAP